MYSYDLLACLAVISSAFVCMSLKKGTRFSVMVIHSGTLFGGLHYSTVSQTFMSTSMEREYRVRSPSPPPSLSQPGRSLLTLPKAKRRKPPPSGRSNTLSTSVSQPWAASRPRQREVYQQEFQMLHLNFWNDEKLGHPSSLKRPWSGV